ncbi:unnamed protein product [Sphagnum tenellum]
MASVGSSEDLAPFVVMCPIANISPDFLITQQKYLTSMAISFTPGQRFQMFFANMDFGASGSKSKGSSSGSGKPKGKYYCGSVIDCEVAGPDKLLPWESLYVKWDENDMAEGTDSGNRVNPWEIEIIQGTNPYGTRSLMAPLRAAQAVPTSSSQLLGGTKLNTSYSGGAFSSNGGGYTDRSSYQVPDTEIWAECRQQATCVAP